MLVSACDCKTEGSNHSVCEHVSGQCVCKPGVSVRDCSKCSHAYYGYSDPAFDGETRIPGPPFFSGIDYCAATSNRHFTLYAN